VEIIRHMRGTSFAWTNLRKADLASIPGVCSKNPIGDRDHLPLNKRVAISVNLQCIRLHEFGGLHSCVRAHDIVDKGLMTSCTLF
jgi:hypothetical protein